MKSLIPVGVAGMGKFVPEKALTNYDLEEMVETSHDWIMKRTGIAERRIAADEDITSTISVRAARQALEEANMSPEELDCILCATVTPDQIFPATACRIGYDLGAVNAGGYDLAAACSGFVFGAQTGAALIANGQYKNVLVIGVEILSRILDYKDRNTCVIFGDGAGAAVFTNLDRAGQGEFLAGSMGMEGGAEDVLAQPAGGSRIPASVDSVDQGLHYMKMGGTKVYKFAVRIFAKLIKQVIDEYGMDDIGVIIPHQVNQRIIENAMANIGVPMDMLFCNIEKYGNTSAASVPIALREAYEAGRLEKGKLVVMPAFGAGMTFGHLLLRW